MLFAILLSISVRVHILPRIWTEFSFLIKTWKVGILKHIRAVTFVKLEYQSHARVCELLRPPRICAARSCVRGGWRIFKSRIPSQSEFGAYLRLLTSKGIKVLRWAYGELGFRPISRLYQIPSALHLGLWYRMRDKPTTLKSLIDIVTNCLAHPSIDLATEGLLCQRCFLR